MKKLFLVVCACMVASLTHAQFVKSDGTIINAKNEVIGYLLVNGTVEDKNHKKLGSIGRDGRIENARRDAVGYIKRNGDIEDEDHNFLTKAIGNERQAALKLFFFP